MITIQQALERIEGLSEQELQELTRDRLLGDDVAPVGSSYTGEPPEDLVIQLLRNSELPPRSRQAVIEGCKEVYVQLQEALLCPRKATGRDWQTVAVHLCGTVDVTSPPGLKGVVYALLDLILYNTDGVSPVFLPPAVRASMGYDQTEDRIPVWEKILKNHPQVAAYAFSALLSIIPQSPRIEKYLQLLWEKQLRQKWPVDTAFLMRRASRKQGSEVIGRVVRWLDEQPYANEAVAELNRREWSRNWVRRSSADFDQSKRDSPGLPITVLSRLLSRGSFDPAEFYDPYVISSLLAQDPRFRRTGISSRDAGLSRGCGPPIIVYDVGRVSNCFPEFSRRNRPKNRYIYWESPAYHHVLSHENTSSSMRNTEWQGR